MNEGGKVSPGMGETLQTTLSENVLSPFEDSVSTVSRGVAATVAEQAARTERTLKAVIGVLSAGLGVVMLMYGIAQRQLNRERQQHQEAEKGLRSMGTAIGLLDDDTRRRVVGALEQPLVPPSASTGSSAKNRRDDYLR
jgi:hypothetical protein